MPYLVLSPREIQTHTDELREINMKRQQPKTSRLLRSYAVATEHSSQVGMTAVFY